MWTLLAIAIPAVLTIAVVGLWLWLRSASPQPPGQHRRPRRDPHDPIRENHEEPPEQRRRTAEQQRRPAESPRAGRLLTFGRLPVTGSVAQNRAASDSLADSPDPKQAQNGEAGPATTRDSW